MNSIPQSIKTTKERIQMARVYNEYTGASITHKDVAEWGFLEIAEIEFAIELISKKE